MNEVSRKPSVVVGIAAHNEERNISGVLESLLTQTEANYILDSIVILCDGCTDSTSNIVEAYAKKDSRVVLMNDGKRFGKIGRINWLFANSVSDILIIFDADIRISDTKMIEKMVRGLVSTEAALVAGMHLPESARSFTEKIFVAWEMIWVETRKNINGGVSVHNIAGCNFGMKRDFYKNIFIPKELIAEDEFLFFEAQKQGVKFVFVPDAIVYYRLPNTIRDYFMQSARFISTKYGISKHFGLSVDSAYKVSLRKKCYALGVMFWRMPILTVLAVALQIFVRLYVRLFPATFENGMWKEVKSTKVN